MLFDAYTHFLGALVGVARCGIYVNINTAVDQYCKFELMRGSLRRLH